MKYKVASDNKKLKERAFLSFNSSGFKEAKHIQEVDFWLVDLKNISQQTLSTYKNKQNYSFVLFLVNSQEEIEHCLENGFTNYLNEDFKTTELKAWCKYYKKSQGNVHISKEEILDFNSRSLLFQSSSINLTLQEFNLLKTLSSGEFFTTKELADIISVESTTSVRTLINRIRSKTDKKFIIQKRGFGYRLNSKKREENSEVNSYLDDLEEEKKILQSIVDSSSIFIVTFIHKKLYCINESFRKYLGVDLVSQLWENYQGDFSKLLKKGDLEELFTDEEHNVILFSSEKDLEFTVRTIYFNKLDKHLLIFNENS